MVEPDLAPRRDQIDGPRAVDDGFGRIEHLEDPLEADHRSHQVDTGVGEPGERLVHPGDQCGERDQGAVGDGAVNDVERSDAVHRRRADGADHAERHEEDPAVHGRRDADVAHSPRPTVEQIDLVAGSSEQLHQLRARHVEPFGHLAVHLGVHAHLLTRDGLQPLAHALGRDHENGQDHQREERETPLERDHRRECGDQHDHVADDAAEGGGDRCLCADHVVVEAADECTGLGAGEEGDRQALHLCEQRDAKVVDEAFTDAGATPPLHDRERRVGQGGDHHHDREHHDQGSVTGLLSLGDRSVEDRPERERRHQGEQRGDEDGDEEPDDDRAVGLRESPRPTQRCTLQPLALHGIGIAGHEHVGPHSHPATIGRGPAAATGPRPCDE